MSDAEIGRIQNYHGVAIRNNCIIVGLRRAIWAKFFPKISTDVIPQCNLCPQRAEIQCEFNIPATSSSYKHNNSISENIMLAVKPIFRYLSQQELFSVSMILLRIQTKV